MMHKKLEKLPGLSNVSGKYTRKFSADEVPPPYGTSSTLSSSETHGLLSSSAKIPSGKVHTSESVPLFRDPTSYERMSSRRGSRTVTGTKHGCNVSSPSCPSSLSSAIDGSRITAAGGGASSSQTQAKKPTDLTKSSSLNSVASLSHKPTGIILATPSVQTNKDKSTLNYSYSKGSLRSSTRRSSVVKQPGPSTPYPSRPSRLIMGPKDEKISITPTSSSAVSSTFHYQATTSRDKIGGDKRPSITVRPFHSVLHAADGGAGGHVQFSKTQPTSTNNASTAKSVQIATEPSVELSQYNNQLSTGVKEFASVRSTRSTHFNTQLNYTSNQPSSSTHVNWRHQLTVNKSPESSLPGPQYTQCALEQYLSDLISGDVPSDMNSATRGRAPLPTSASSTSSFSPLEPLLLLERRLQIALDGIQKKTDMNHSVSATSGLFPGRMIRDRSFQHQEPASLFSTKSNETSTPALLSHHGPPPPTVSNNMLEEFSENELRYLLRAVQELLRSRNHFPGSWDSVDAESRISSGHDDHGGRDGRRMTEFGSRTTTTSGRASDTSKSTCLLTEANNPTSSDGTAPSTSGVECDPSAAEIMHKRLPLGFQHFKRYLDDKFGPDQLHGTAQRTTGGPSTGLPPECQFVPSSDRLGDVNPDVGSSAISDNQIRLPTDMVNFAYTPRRRITECDKNDEWNHNLSSADTHYQNTLLTGFNSTASTQCTSLPTASLYPDNMSYLPPQQYDLSPSLASTPFHQRSYCSTPEVVEPHAHPSPAYMDQFRHHCTGVMPHFHGWPNIQQYHYYAPLLSPHHHHNHLGAPCMCLVDGGQLMDYPPPPLQQQRLRNFGQPFIPPGPFNNFGDHGVFKHPYTPPFPYGSPVESYGAGWECGTHVDHTVAPIVYPGHNRLQCILPSSPTYDPSTWATTASIGYPATRLIPYQPMMSPCNFHMPRSGSANAGFGCLTDSSTTSGLNMNTNAGYHHPRMMREQSAGPDTNPAMQPPVLRPAHRSSTTRCIAAPLFTHQNTIRGGSSLLSSPQMVQESVNLVSTMPVHQLRPMSNSFSANDLAGCRNLTSVELRSSKSSFGLSPELPCEPTLMLYDGTEFYSRISAFIELDNRGLVLPPGWSERRCPTGRLYYTCDQTRETIWYHPTFGAQVPFGWERVDSEVNGVFYQHLLIPHCQRHHPNLWVRGPIKDPSLEYETFFSDLRHLQSSSRHQPTAHFAELEAYLNSSTPVDMEQFLEFFWRLDVESMVGVTRALEQWFYRELRSIVVLFERRRLHIASAMFTMDQCETILPNTTEAT